MPNPQIQSLTVNGTTYDIVDNTSGYMDGMTILSYGSSTWQDFINAYSKNKVVYCRASSQTNPATGDQTRLAFMAYVNDEDNPTSVEFQYYRSVSTKTESQQGDQVFIYTLTSAGNWSVTTREASVKVAAGGDLTGSYSNGTYTVSGTIPTVPTNISAFTNDAGYVTTDEKLKTTSDNETALYPVLTGTSTSAEAKKYSTLLQFDSYGTARSLSIGSATKAGAIRLYNANSGSVTLQFDSTAAYNRSIIIPNKSGSNVTLATVQDIPDVSGLAPLASPAFTGTPTAPTPTSGDDSTKIATTAFVQDAMSAAGAGTVTSVGVSNATDGGLSVSGSPITSSGTITIGHSNVLTSAQTTQAVYPIKIDKNGHISAYGSAVTIPTKVSDLTNDSGFVTTDTKNTAGSTNTSSKIYLIGATEQSANPQTYSNSTLYFNHGLYSFVQNGNTGAQSEIKQDYGTVEIYGNDATFKRKTIINVETDKTSISGKNGNNDAVEYISVNYNGNVVVTGLVTPTNNTDAATKKYVDDSIPTVPTISLNGSSTTAAAFYAPTSAGTNGYYLKSNGSGAPTWTNFPTIPTKTSDLTNDSGFITDVSDKVDKTYTLNGETSSINYNSGDGTVNITSTNSYETAQITTYNNSVSLYSATSDDDPTISHPGGSSNIFLDWGALTIDAIDNNVSATHFDPAIRIEPEETTIKYVVTPTDDGDAANKQYVDDSIPTVPTNVSAFTNDAGYVTTDEKLKTSALGVSTTTYYPVLTTDASSAETKKYSTVLQVRYKDSNYDVFRVRIGNGIGVQGSLELANANSGASNNYTELITSGTAARTITLPDATGTVALTSDIPTVPTNVSAFTNDAGYLTAHQTIPVTDVKMNGSSIVSGGIAAITNASGDVTFNGTVQGNLFYMNLATSDSLYTAINTAGWRSAVIV